MRLLTIFKASIRDSIPKRFQIPAKYWFSAIRGDLEREMKLLPILLHRGGRFIDVGANQGVYAYATAKLCQHVELFEPNPYCAASLSSFAEDRSNVRVYNVGLSDRRSPAVLRVPVDETGVEHDSAATLEDISAGRFHEHFVQLTTLDSFGFSDVALIKIDVEGHESRVLYGAAQTISSQKPALLVEIEQRHIKRPVEEVFKQVQAFGYEGFFLGSNNTLHPLSKFEAVTHQSVTNLGGRSSLYINNFLFLHPLRLAAGHYPSIINTC